MSNKLVKVLADSRSETGERVTTLVFKAPKFLDAEFEKHGNICSNGSSSRARSFPICENEPYMPEKGRLYSPAKSMHGTEIVDPGVADAFLADLEIMFRGNAEVLSYYKNLIHKQHLNRYVEAFTWQTKVATANEYAWNNFLQLRCADNADPAIRRLAEEIKEALSTSQTNELIAVHVPLFQDSKGNDPSYVSAGRIARVSYDLMDSFEDANAAFDRALMLEEHSHKTPFEHQLFTGSIPTPTEFVTNPDIWYPEGWTHTDGIHMYSGRIRGWVQLRKLIWHGLDETETLKN